MLLVWLFPRDESAENASCDTAVSAARRVPEIHDQATRIAKAEESAIERRNEGTVAQGIVDADIADPGPDLRCTEHLSSAVELITGWQFYCPNVAFLNLEDPTGVVTPCQDRSQSPIARGHDGVRIRATELDLDGVGDGHAIDGDNNHVGLDPCAFRVGARADLR